MRDEQFGRGQNTGVGWNDPTFAADCVAKVTRGVVPAHSGETKPCFARAPPRSWRLCMSTLVIHACKKEDVYVGSQSPTETTKECDTASSR